jgi:biotin transport system substrate-specific component
MVPLSRLTKKQIWNQNSRGYNVNKDIASQLPPAALRNPAVSPWLRSTGIVLSGSALVAACAHITLPLWFTPVPLTLGNFAVLLLGLLLAPRMATATLAVYLAEGALGLPVFAPNSATAGLAHLFGPTGGYLLAYPAAALLISFLWRRTGRGFSAALVSTALGNLFILVCGASWLAALTHASARTALTLAVFPFLPGDALKVAAAAALAFGAARMRRHAMESHRNDV